MKLYHYPDEPTVLWAAKVVGRQVRWTGTRSESLASDTHARDQHTVGRIAFDADTGQYLSGTFMDYAIPRAADLPSFALDSNATLDPDNPLGIRGPAKAAPSAHRRAFATVSSTPCGASAFNRSLNP